MLDIGPPLKGKNDLHLLNEYTSYKIIKMLNESSLNLNKYYIILLLCGHKVFTKIANLKVLPDSMSLRDVIEEDFKKKRE